MEQQQLRKRKWTQQEEKLLVEYAHDFRYFTWQEIGEKLGRSAIACRYRYWFLRDTKSPLVEWWQHL